MMFVQDLVKKAEQAGYAPVLNRKGSYIMRFQCPECKGNKMLRFKKKPDMRNRYSVCPDCGYRKRSAKFEAMNGAFVHF